MINLPIFMTPSLETGFPQPIFTIESPIYNKSPFRF